MKIYECRYCDKDLLPGEEELHKWGRCLDTDSVWSKETQNSINKTKELGKELQLLAKEISNKNMILTTNTQALVNYNKAADDILTLIDNFGFTTDKPFGSLDFKHKIVAAMISSVQATSDEIITVDAVEQEPTDEDLDELFAALTEEDEQEQLLHVNECSVCGKIPKDYPVCAQCGQPVEGDVNSARLVQKKDGTRHWKS